MTSSNRPVPDFLGGWCGKGGCPYGAWKYGGCGEGKSSREGGCQFDMALHLNVITNNPERPNL
jgi:hypothetical protein